MSLHVSHPRRYLILAAVVLLLAALACESSFSVGDTEGSLTVVNDSSLEICYVFISPSDSDSWGDDWLGEDNTIPPGESHDIAGVEPGTYDIMAADCDGNEIDSDTCIEFEAGSNVTWTFTDN